MSEITTSIAEQINAAHAACLASMSDSVVKAIEVGRLLSEAKAKLTHGEWIPWVEVNCDFDIRSAQVYMQAFKNRELLENQIRSTASYLDSMRGALRAIDQAELESIPWSKTELARKKTVEAGRSVTANIKEDLRLIAWAQEQGLYVRIDRQTAWGNPFIVDEDGDRDEVIENFDLHYLACKPSLQRRFDELRGKVLGCWCYPDDCHGDVLIRNAYGECAPDEVRRVGCHR